MPKNAFVLVCLFLASAALLSAQVKVTVAAGRIDVAVNGKPFTSFQQGQDAHKPYLWPIYSASGKPVTRWFPMEKVPGEMTDHPHQRGLWLGIEHLSGMNFWELDPADPHPHMGKIVFQKVIETHDGPQSGGFTIAAQWITPDGKPIIDETLAFTFYAQPEQSHMRMFDVDMRLKAITLATFEDARDGVIAIRLSPAFDESRGGKVRTAEGVQGAANVLGTRSHWADWETNLDGEKVGVAIMDYPSNYGAPAFWRARAYSLLSANPFSQRFWDKSLKDGSLGLQPGDELLLRYRVVIHPDGTDLAKLFKEYSLQ